MRVKVAQGSFPAAHRYGEGPIIAGFELDCFRNLQGGDEDDVSSELLERLERARWRFFLTTTMGRSVADLRIQSFGAATLAIVTDGTVFDGQQGRYFTGEAAIANAAREADEYEREWARPAQWDLCKFVRWPTPEEERDWA
jgi:hypothetical protein